MAEIIVIKFFSPYRPIPTTHSTSNSTFDSLFKRVCDSSRALLEPIAGVMGGPLDCRATLKDADHSQSHANYQARLLVGATCMVWSVGESPEDPGRRRKGPQLLGSELPRTCCSCNSWQKLLENIWIELKCLSVLQQTGSGLQLCWLRVVSPPKNGQETKYRQKVRCVFFLSVCSCGRRLYLTTTPRMDFLKFTVNTRRRTVVFYSLVLFLLCVVMHQFVLRMTVSSVSSILLLQDLRSDQSVSTVEENTRLDHGSNHYKGVFITSYTSTSTFFPQHFWFKLEMKT